MKAARAEDAHISRGTVYRNLNYLAQTGEIQKLSTPFGSDHYDRCTDSHYHFLCRRCGRVFDTPIPYQEALSRTPASMPGFVAERHSLLLIGLCQECAAQPEPTL